MGSYQTLLSVRADQFLQINVYFRVVSLSELIVTRQKILVLLVLYQSFCSGVILLFVFIKDEHNVGHAKHVLSSGEDIYHLTASLRLLYLSTDLQIKNPPPGRSLRSRCVEGVGCPQKTLTWFSTSLLGKSREQNSLTMMLARYKWFFSVRSWFKG